MNESYSALQKIGHLCNVGSRKIILVQILFNSYDENST
jgi:hypothetical protein